MSEVSEVASAMAAYRESRPAPAKVSVPPSNGLDNRYLEKCDKRDSPDSRVGFSQQSRDEIHEKKKKYLTAKYGLHQMKLIRKRLNVEDWMDGQLRELYDCQGDLDSYDCEIDLDEVLDLEENKRRQFILGLLNNVSRTELIDQFLEDLLEKVKTL